MFDVGNLLLTTIDPKADFATGEFLFGKSYLLNGPVDPKSFVRIEQGAKINAIQETSYVAVASPIVEQFGAVSVNGSTAYVAAESVTLTINQGLFDIQVQTGSSSGAATLVHTGSTGGPASTAAGDNHKIYMVAVPKDAAISLLLRGSVGYDAAVGADVENGEIILSAGYNVSEQAAFSGQASPTDARIDIRQTTASSDLVGIATTSAVATAFGGETSSFQQDVSLYSPDSNLGSEGGSLTVGGDAARHDRARAGLRPVQSRRRPGEHLLPGRRNGQHRRRCTDKRKRPGVTRRRRDRRATPALSADGGTINITGNVRVLAEAEPAEGFAEDPGDSIGGDALIMAINGGRILVGGSAAASANAIGGANAGAGDGIPGAARGGNAGASANGAGSVIGVTNGLSLTATALGGMARPGAVSAQLRNRRNCAASRRRGRPVKISGTTLLDSSGQGGTGITVPPPDVSGADGIAGSSQILVNGGNVQLDTLRLTSVGTGGDATGTGASGGSGTGGFAQMQMSGAGSALLAQDSLLTSARNWRSRPSCRDWRPAARSGRSAPARGSSAASWRRIREAMAASRMSGWRRASPPLADATIRIGGPSRRRS